MFVVHYLEMLKEADLIMKRSWSRILAVTMGIPLLLAILAACGSGTTSSGSSSTPTGSKTIKIATELPVSGKDESSGKPAEDGAHLAVNQANANHCLTKDTDASGCSGKNNLLPTLRPTNKVSYFRVATTDDHQGPAGADYLYKQGAKKVYVIDDAETYGIGIANTFVGEWQKLGGTVLGHSSEPGTTTSFVSLLTQVASMHPDAIYFGGVDSTGGTLVRQQMRQVPGLANLPYGGGDGIVTPSFASTIQS